MACMSVGSVPRVLAGQNDVVKSNPPSLMYDSKGTMSVMLAALRLNTDSQNAKELQCARIKVLEANFADYASTEKEASSNCALSVIGAAVSLFFPPVALIAVPVGIVKGIMDGHHAGCTGVKRHWLQVELDAEKAFAEKHPDKLGDDEARKEFVYNFIFNHDPGYTLGENRSGSYTHWSANRHVFPEAQKKYDELARNKEVPVREYIDYD